MGFFCGRLFSGSILIDICGLLLGSPWHDLVVLTLKSLWEVFWVEKKPQKRVLDPRKAQNCSILAGIAKLGTFRGVTKKIFESLVSTEAHLRRQKIKKTAGKNRLFIPCPFLAGVPGYLLFIPCSNLLFFPHPSHLRLKNAGKKTYFISCPPKAFWLEAQYLEAIKIIAAQRRKLLTNSFNLHTIYFFVLGATH